MPNSARPSRPAAPPFSTSSNAKGPIAAEALADRLGITAMAVRQHLAGAGGRRADAATKRGPRPAAGRRNYWRATATADAHFADSHAHLAADLIGQMKKAFGEEGLDRLLELRTAEQARTYRAPWANADAEGAPGSAGRHPLRRKAIWPRCAASRKRARGCFVENHCPICAAARLCTGLCREELSLFHKVLGRDVRIERVSHILAGAGRCAYRVTPRA